MACTKLSTCNCVCTAVQIAGLTYNSVNYDTTTGFLEPETYPELGCSCVLSAVVPMKRTGSGSPGIFDDLTIRVELHDNCIMYAEASLAVSGTPKWSGRCGSTLDCTSGRFSCGIPGLGGMINLQSWVEFGNSFNLVIDGDPCESPSCVGCAANCDGAASMSGVVSGTGDATLDGIYATMTRIAACYWSGPRTSPLPSYDRLIVQCWPGDSIWRVYLQRGFFVIDRSEDTAALRCSGNHPTGSGTFTTVGPGNWTLS
jgi:hypothetical protein